MKLDSIFLKTIKLILTFSILATLTVAVQVHKIDEAQACRDCPFPMPLARLHWLMPGGFSEVTIEEINLGRGRIQSVVRLIDVETGELLAIGRLDHARGRKRLKVELFDMKGGEMQVDLHYRNSTRDQIRIKFTCVQCKLKSSYLN